MDINSIYHVLLSILLLSIANFSSISALKNTKLDSIKLAPTHTNLAAFTQFVQVKLNEKKKSKLFIP